MAISTISRSARGSRSPRDPAAPLRHIDIMLLLTVASITAIGLLMVYSATRRQQVAAGLDPQHFLQRQAMYVGIGVMAMVVVTLVDYRGLRDVAPVVYLGMVVVLLLVLSPLGSESRGTQAWFQFGSFQVEPSEFAKLGVIACVAAYCSAHRGDLDTVPVLTALALAGVPMALIYLQPDLGTDLVFAAIFMAILLVAGARARHIAALTGVGVLAFAALLQFGVLKQYQIDRLTAFLDPQEDTQRSTYNLRQSQIAIAAGGLAGRGVFQGSQTNLSFVPEQHTDFIFTAVGEELGFAGAGTLLALFGILIWRTWRAAALARDRFGTLLCVGVLAMLAFQVFENVGMTMNITPIAGIPLPFVSYGGSATVASFMAIGLVLNVHMRRYS